MICLENFLLVLSIMRLEKSYNSTIAVIGGGRWGQVTLSILANMNLPYHYVIVSNVNYNEIKRKLDAFSSSLSSFSIVHSITDLLRLYEVKGAIVVNSARLHFKTARSMIKNGIHVLIEKPIVLSTLEMECLIEDARKNNICIVPGLCYRFCSYIHHFALLVKNNGIPYKFLFEWYDAKNEMRYGHKKIHDSSINVIQDVMPHIWTILFIIFKLNLHIEFCQLSSDGEYARILVSIGDARGQIILNRANIERKRYLTLEFTSGKHLAIDFTSEPGHIIEGMRKLSGDMNWNNHSSPLTKQLCYFFSVINDMFFEKNDIEACLQSVKCTDESLSLI